MTRLLRYVERVDGAHTGEAWIALLEPSRSGATLFFAGRALRCLRGRQLGASHLCEETGQRFWVSGVKRRGSNRHPHGAGPVRVDRAAVSALLAHLGEAALDPARFTVGELPGSGARRAELHRHANQSLRRLSPDLDAEPGDEA